DRKVTSGTARGEDLLWCTESYIRAGKLREALGAVKDNPYGLCMLARRFAEQGNGPLADEARTKTPTLLDKQRGDEPDNGAPAAELADLLLMDNRAEWTVLKPTEMKSEGGATLTLKEDGSVLASGKNPDQDSYTLICPTSLESISALRL